MAAGQEAVDLRAIDVGLAAAALDVVDPDHRLARAHRLAEVDASYEAHDGPVSVLILSDGDQRAAVVLGEHVDIVDRPIVLSDPRPVAFGAASTTIDGSLVTLLDGAALLQHLHGREGIHRAVGRALICEASPLLSRIARRALEAMGLSTAAAEDAAVARAHLQDGAFDLLVADDGWASALGADVPRLDLSRLSSDEGLAGRGDRFVPRDHLQRMVEARLDGPPGGP